MTTKLETAEDLAIQLANLTIPFGIDGYEMSEEGIALIKKRDNAVRRELLGAIMHELHALHLPADHASDVLALVARVNVKYVTDPEATRRDT